MAVASPIRTRRYISYAGSVLVSLSSGTGYAFGLIASPMAERLAFSATSINFVGAAGNWGMYLLGPLSGYVVDKCGPKIPLLIATFCMFSGFYGLNQAYINEDRSASPSLLAFYMFLTGIGSCAGFNAALNAAAKNFPLSRGTATAFPIAALGLCAFLYGTIAKMAVPGDTGSFLLILAVMTSVSEFIGFLVIQVFPGQSLNHSWGRRRLYRQKSDESRLSEDESRDDIPEEAVRILPTGDREHTPTTTLAQSAIPSESSAPRAALRNPDFWIMAFIIERVWSHVHKRYYSLFGLSLSLISLQNVGHCVDALFDSIGDSHDHSRALSKVQAAHVSIISLSSCVGRITAGTSSDFLLKRYRLQRTWCLVCASIVAIIAQLSGWLISTLDFLYLVSSLTGFAYGLLFGCSPVIASELFGIETFSQNWGWISLTPAFSSTLFNFVYGRIYDAHSDEISNRCHQGHTCYASAFVLTLISAITALGFSLHLHLRQTKLPSELSYLD